jgi:hypothetical protein
MLRSSRTGPTKIGSLTRASTVVVGALVALFGVIAGPLLGVFVTSASAAATASSYTAITPFRALGTASAGTPVVAGTPAAVAIVGNTAAPTAVPSGATAVVLNVTASAPTSAGYLEVYPTGAAPASPTSNVNFVAGETVANLVTVPLSAAGSVSVLNFAGTTAVDVDVEGYYSASGTGLYNPVSPVRVAGTAASGVAVAANTAVPVTVTGGTIPAGATAVVVNLTAAGGTSASYLSAYAAGATPATTSSLNFTAGETVANRDVVNVGTAGQIEVYNFAGSVNVDVDVDGYYGATGAVFTPLAAPVRVADTRATSTVGTQTSIASGGTETFNLSTTASTIPATATAVAANFTVVPGAAPGYITVFPTGVTTNPTASDVNWPASSGPVANFTQADTAGTTGGSVQVYNLNSGSPIDLVVDAFGYFTGGTTAASVAPVAVPVTNPVTTVVTGTPLPANGITTEAINTTVYHGTAIAANEVTGDTVQFTVADGTSASCGTVSPTSVVTNGSGLATATYKAPAYSASPLTTGTCIITATDSIYQETGSTSIGQTVPPSTLAVSGGANLPANASSQDTLSVTVTPYPGVSAASDLVTFALGTHCGTLATPTATTPATGAAVATDVYTAPATSGICQIAVSDALGGTANLNIDATTSPTPSAGTLTVTAPTTNPDSVAVGSAAVSVTVVAKDSTSTPIVGDEVLFTPTGDCTGTGSYQPTAAGGAVTFTYTPEATTVGTCTIAAQESNTGASASVVINQTALPTTIALTGGATLAPGISETLTVTPSNPPTTDAGAAITFTVTGSAGCGTVPATTGAGSTPYGGTSTYTAGASSGFCNVTATEGGVTSNTLQIDQT